MDYSEVIREAWNHAAIVVVVFSLWTGVLSYFGGKKILWDYEAFEEKEAH